MLGCCMPTHGATDCEAKSLGHSNAGNEIQVCDPSNRPRWNLCRRAYTLNVLKAVTIYSKSLKVSRVGRSYNATVIATGGATPYHWELLPGTASASLNFNGVTGQLTGIPTSPGSFDLTFHVVDSLGGQAQKALKLTVR